MNTYRVTLRAFGTSGVLLAASVAMLATVSALVAFNGWPQVDRSGGVDSVSVTGGARSSALIVRTTPRPAAARHARGAAPAGFVKVVGPSGGGAAGGGFAPGFARPAGPGGSSFGPVRFAPGPSPSVPGTPYGEGGGSGTPLPASDVIPGPVQNAACGAGGSVCGVTQVGNSLGDSPPVATPPTPVAPVELPAPGPLPGG